jgi:hypothetical protein
MRDHAVCYNSLIKPVSRGLFVPKPTQLHNEALFAGKGTYCQSETEATDVVRQPAYATFPTVKNGVFWDTSNLIFPTVSTQDTQITDTDI